MTHIKSPAARTRKSTTPAKSNSKAGYFSKMMPKGKRAKQAIYAGKSLAVIAGSTSLTDYVGATWQGAGKEGEFPQFKNQPVDTRLVLGVALTGLACWKPQTNATILEASAGVLSSYLSSKSFSKGLEMGQRYAAKKAAANPAPPVASGVVGAVDEAGFLPFAAAAAIRNTRGGLDRRSERVGRRMERLSNRQERLGNTPTNGERLLEARSRMEQGFGRRQDYRSEMVTVPRSAVRPGYRY